MLSIETIRKEPEFVREALLKRGETASLEELLEIDKKRRHSVQKGDELRARLNEASKHIAQTGERPPELLEELRLLGDEIKVLEQQASELGTRANSLLLELPNLPQDDVPTGMSEADNVVVRTWGEPPFFDFTPPLGPGRAFGHHRFPTGSKAVGLPFLRTEGHGRQAGAVPD